MRALRTVFTPPPCSLSPFAYTDALLRIVKACNTRYRKLGIILVWIALGVTGFVVMQPFISSLKSTVPPVEGTQAYDAQEAMDNDFFAPRGATKSHNLAMVISTVDGSPLLDCSDSADYRSVIASIDASPVSKAWYDMLVGARDASPDGFSFYPGKLSAIRDIICDK